MAKYIAKRLLYIIPTFFALTFIVFAILSLAPGDPVLVILGPNATQDQIDIVRNDLGLNDSMFVRYVKYMVDMLQGNLGKSWIDGTAVLKQLMVRLPNTLLLSAYAVILTIVVGIPMGVIAAVKQNSVIDRITLIFALIFISIPAFFLALIAQLIFTLKLNLLPAAGAESFKYFIMPTIILSAAQIATQVRMTRSSMLDVIQQDYIRTAFAKGANKFRVISYHALRNALLPVVTGIGNSIAYLISGAAIIEIVFAIPGIGSLLVNAVRTKDVPVVMGTIIFVSLIVCLTNLVVDLLYAFIDPRVKHKFIK